MYTTYHHSDISDMDELDRYFASDESAQETIKNLSSYLNITAFAELVKDYTTVDLLADDSFHFEGFDIPEALISALSEESKSPRFKRSSRRNRRRAFRRILRSYSASPPISTPTPAPTSIPTPSFVPTSIPMFTSPSPTPSLPVSPPISTPTLSPVSLSPIRGRPAAKDGDPRRKYKCTEHGCVYNFTRSSHLKRHMITVHGKGKCYKCPTCGSSFSRKDNMNSHIDSVHKE